MIFEIGWQLVLIRSRESDFQLECRSPPRTVIVCLVVLRHRHDDGREDLGCNVASVTKLAVSVLVCPSA